MMGRLSISAHGSVESGVHLPQKEKGKVDGLLFFDESARLSHIDPL